MNWIRDNEPTFRVNISEVFQKRHTTRDPFKCPGNPTNGPSHDLFLVQPAAGARDCPCSPWTLLRTSFQQLNTPQKKMQWWSGMICSIYSKKKYVNFIPVAEFTKSEIKVTLLLESTHLQCGPKIWPMFHQELRDAKHQVLARGVFNGKEHQVQKLQEVDSIIFARWVSFPPGHTRHIATIPCWYFVWCKCKHTFYNSKSEHVRGGVQ